MPVIATRAWVAAPIEESFAFFDDPANLARLMPPPVSIRPVRVEPSPPRAGTEIEFRYGIGPFRRSWVIRFVEHRPPHLMVDETLSGPMRRFHHSHRFGTARNGGTWIEDTVDFHVGPDGVLGRVVDALAAAAMRAIFVWRQARQRRLLER
jgi:ligand-binding SRPBCC domain-containing protein